jgi:hypothetical protein
MLKDAKRCTGIVIRERRCLFSVVSSSSPLLFIVHKDYMHSSFSILSKQVHVLQADRRSLSNI